MENKELYKPFVNKTNSNYKYFVYVMRNGKIKKIGFGNKQYQQYFDKGKFYKKLNHNDSKRRENYLKRSKAIKTKDGTLTYNNKNYSNYWSRVWLWSA